MLCKHSSENIAAIDVLDLGPDRFKYLLNNLINTVFIFILLSFIAVNFSAGQTSVKKNIFFDYDSSALKPGSVETLNEYIAKMKNNPNSNLTVTGYSDQKGKADYNKRLSQKRIDLKSQNF